MAKSTLILLLAGGVVGFVVASLTLALTGALTSFGRNTARYGVARGTALTVCGALLFALHFLPGRWGLLSYAGAGVFVLATAWWQLARRRDRPIHEQLRDRPDGLMSGLDPAAARVRRARTLQVTAIAGATALAILGAAVDLPWLIGAGFVIAVATVAVTAADVHRDQMEGSLTAPGFQAPSWRRVLDVGAAVLLAASIAGIGTAVRGLSDPPDWNQVRFGNAGVAYAAPDGNAGELDASAELNGEPPATYHPRLELELWRAGEKRGVVRVQFGSAHDGHRTPLASDLYDPATHRTVPLPRGSTVALVTGEISLRFPLAGLPRPITGWRLVVPAERGFSAGVFPPYAGPAALTVIRPPRPLAPIAIAQVSAALRGGPSARVLDGSLRIAGTIPRTAATTVAVNLVAADENATQPDDELTQVALDFGGAHNGSRPLVGVHFRAGLTVLRYTPPGVRATLVGDRVRFHVPLGSVSADICCYAAWIHVTTRDGGTLYAVAPKPPARARPLAGAGAARPSRIPGLVVRGASTRIDGRVLKVVFDVPEIPTMDASMIYVIDLMGRNQLVPRAKVVIELEASRGRLHATHRILVVSPAGSSLDSSDLPASDVTVPPHGGALVLRVPLPTLGAGVCCWVGAVTALAHDGSAFAPVTYSIALRPLGQSGRAVDAGG